MGTEQTAGEPVWPPFTERAICATVGICLLLLTIYIALSAWASTPADPLFGLCVDPLSSKHWSKPDYLLGLILFSAAGNVGLVASLTRNYKIYYWKSAFPPPSPRLTIFFSVILLFGILVGELLHAQIALSSFDAEGRCKHALKGSGADAGT